MAALSGKKICMLVEEDFEDSELLEPLEAMRQAGALVTIVGPTRGNYRGKRGKVTVAADATVEQVQEGDFDAIIVPGGYAPDKMRLDGSIVNLVKEACAQGKVVAAICHGPQLLISADVVRGRTVTSWLSIAIDLRNAGAQWVDQPVVQDGNLITSRKPADIPQFNQAIIRALIGVPTRT